MAIFHPPAHSRQPTSFALKQKNTDQALFQITLSGDRHTWSLLDSRDRTQNEILLTINPGSCKSFKVRFDPEPQTEDLDYTAVINVTCAIGSCNKSYRIDAKAKGLASTTAQPETDVTFMGELAFDGLVISGLLFRQNQNDGNNVLELYSTVGIKHPLTFEDSGDMVPGSPTRFPQQVLTSIQNGVPKTACLTPQDYLVQISQGDVQLTNTTTEIGSHRFNLPSPASASLPLTVISNNPNLRLVETNCNTAHSGNTRDVEGRVEIFHNGQWGTICDDFIDENNRGAMTACGELGYSPANAVSLRSCPAGSGPIWLDELVCTGNEQRLTDCLHNNFGNNDCDHSEDYGIACNYLSFGRAFPCFSNNQHVLWFCGTKLCSFSLPGFIAGQPEVNEFADSAAFDLDNLISKVFIDTTSVLQANGSGLVLAKVQGENITQTDNSTLPSNLISLSSQPGRSRAYSLMTNKNKNSFYLARITVSEDKIINVEPNLTTVDSPFTPVRMVASGAGIIVLHDAVTNRLRFYRDSLFSTSTATTPVANPTSDSGVSNIVIYSSVGVGGMLILTTAAVVAIAVYLKC